MCAGESLEHRQSPHFSLSRVQGAGFSALSTLQPAFSGSPEAILLCLAGPSPRGGGPNSIDATKDLVHLKPLLPIYSLIAWGCLACAQDETLFLP